MDRTHNNEYEEWVVLVGVGSGSLMSLRGICIEAHASELAARHLTRRLLVGSNTNNNHLV